MTDGEGNIVDIGPRIGAVILDTIVIVVIFVILAAIIAVIGYAAATTGRGFGLLFGIPFMAGMFLLPILYFAFFEAYMNGQTPGKMLVKIKVVKVTGEPIGLGESLIRNILRIIDELPFFYLLGFILIMTNDKKQRLGDMAAGTIVVKSE